MSFAVQHPCPPLLRPQPCVSNNNSVTSNSHRSGQGCGKAKWRARATSATAATAAATAATAATANAPLRATHGAPLSWRLARAIHSAPATAAATAAAAAAAATALCAFSKARLVLNNGRNAGSLTRRCRSRRPRATQWGKALPQAPPAHVHPLRRRAGTETELSLNAVGLQLRGSITQVRHLPRTREQQHMWLAGGGVRPRGFPRESLSRGQQLPRARSWQQRREASIPFPSQWRGAVLKIRQYGNCYALRVPTLLQRVKTNRRLFAINPSRNFCLAFRDATALAQLLCNCACVVAPSATIFPPQPKRLKSFPTSSTPSRRSSSRHNSFPNGGQTSPSSRGPPLFRPWFSFSLPDCCSATFSFAACAAPAVPAACGRRGALSKWPHLPENLLVVLRTWCVCGLGGGNRQRCLLCCR